MKPLFQAFSLISIAPLSIRTQEQFEMPVTRADTGQKIALGHFLVSVAASRIGSATGVPAVAVVCWGNGAKQAIFNKIVDALQTIPLHGGEWNAEGMGKQWGGGKFIHWVSAYAVQESTTATYSEISPVANYEKVLGAIEAWVHHLVQHGGSEDSLVFAIVAVANTQESASELVEAVQHVLPVE